MEESSLPNLRPKKSKLPVLILAGVVLAVALVAAGYFIMIKQRVEIAESPPPTVQQQASAGSAQDQGLANIVPQPGPDAPRMLFYGNYAVKMWSNGNFNTVADFSQSSSSVSSIAISPDAQKFIYGYYNYDRDGGAAGMFSSGINSLATADFAGSFSVDIGEKGKTAKWNFKWSPDSSKVSYVVNDGKALEILDIASNKVLLHLDGQETTPVTWLSNSFFSFVQDHKLYTGTLDKPKENLIADGVYNSLCTFEDPPFLVAPNWSKDGRFVGYYTKDSYLIKDTQTGSTVKALTTQITDEAGICGNSVDIGVIGWDANNNFYFSTGAGGNGRDVYQITLPAGDQVKFENLYAGPGTTLTQISPDGRYFVFAPASTNYSQGSRSGFTINNYGKDGDRVCNNEFAFTGVPASTAERGWSKKSPGVVVIETPLPQGYVLTPFDVVRCKILANVMVPESYGDNGLNYAGVQ